jgi:hypothetical protein
VGLRAGLDRCGKSRYTGIRYRTASTVAKPYSDEPGCTVQVDIYRTVPVAATAVCLKMNPLVRNTYRQKILWKIEQNFKLNLTEVRFVGLHLKV